MARDRRPRDDDEDEDDRPRRRRRPAEEEEDDDEPRPRKKVRAVSDDDEDERPRRRRRVVDEDDDDDRPRRRRRKKPAGMNKGLLFGLIGGGVALVGLVILLIVLLGGSSPTSVMKRVIRASSNGDYGTVYDNMSAKTQERFASGGLRLPGMGGIVATDPRERYIATRKLAEQLGGNRFAKEKDATVVSETITGDTATVLIRDSNGRESRIPFIKENGRWKLGGL